MFEKSNLLLVQVGGNKATILNQRKACFISFLTFECVTFDFRAAVLALATVSRGYTDKTHGLGLKTLIFP